MAKLSEFMGKLLKKPDITSEEEQWRISAKMDNNVDYHCGYRDCTAVVCSRLKLFAEEFDRLADESFDKWNKEADIREDQKGLDFMWFASRIRDVIDEVKSNE